MTKCEYVEQYNELPESLEEFAYGALNVTDDPELKRDAEEFIAAMEKFQVRLDKIGVEIG